MRLRVLPARLRCACVLITRLLSTSILLCVHILVSMFHTCWLDLCTFNSALHVARNSFQTVPEADLHCLAPQPLDSMRTATRCILATARSLTPYVDMHMHLQVTCAFALTYVCDSGMCVNDVAALY